jgi:hypothetical protein
MNRTHRTRPPFARRALLAFTAVAALGTFTPLLAEPPVAPQGAAAAQDDPMQAARKLQDEYMELQNRLRMIQEKAVKAHPELQKQEQALEELMMARMTSSSGKNAQDELAAIEKLEQKLRSKDTPESERQALMAEYQDKAKAFRTAQFEVMQDPDVKKTQATLMNATLAAMKEQDPQTGQLVEQLHQKQEQMRQLMESAGHTR